MNFKPNTFPQFDVAIIGGGPGGATTGCLLKKYNPDISVLIVEKEKFPREHVGESQLPPIGLILEEMGCWDKIEAANFPIKIGGTFRWGKSSNLWDIQFIPSSKFNDEPRPGKYEGQRKLTAFQVERSVYDSILLNHAAELGCTVWEKTRIDKVLHEGDHVVALQPDKGALISAHYYVDATGYIGTLRKSLGIPIHCPTRLKNIAIWDYWENAEWAVEIGVGGTLVQIMSIEYGWIWFIPLSPTRTSIGLVCPMNYYKKMKKLPKDLYHEAIRKDPTISRLVRNARCRNKISTTNDWSFLSDRTVGLNWFLVGESAGFADPILSAGLTLTHQGAREAAYTILELLAGHNDPDWLKNSYDSNQRKRISQHIRFADFFYAANGQFTNLKEHCREIAKEAGLNMTGDEAWQWLAQGGFTNEMIGLPAIAGFDFDSAKQVTELLIQDEISWSASNYNVFELNLDGATMDFVPVYINGRVIKTKCYKRNGIRLPVTGMFGLVIQILQNSSNVKTILEDAMTFLKSTTPTQNIKVALRQVIQVLEVMVSEGWVLPSLDESQPRLILSTPTDGTMVHNYPLSDVDSADLLMEVPRGR